MKIATRFEIIDGRIQLFDADNNRLSGKGTKWEGIFDCSHNNLTTLNGAPEVVGYGFNCAHNNLTTLKGAPEVVGDSFYCADNNLTTLDGAPGVVEGSFYCAYNNLTISKKAPKAGQDVFGHFLKRGLILCDGILLEKISCRQQDDITIYKTKRLVRNEIIYVCKLGEDTSHGATVKKAMSDLRFKMASRDIKQYKNMDINTEKSLDEWVIIYRAITGSCKEGIRLFLERQENLKERYKLSEVLSIVEGEYRSTVFKETVGY